VGVPAPSVEKMKHDRAPATTLISQTLEFADPESVPSVVVVGVLYSVVVGAAFVFAVMRAGLSFA